MDKNKHKMVIHVFIDTNIFLDFFRCSDASLEDLNRIFDADDGGAVNIHLTKQIYNELYNNMDSVTSLSIQGFQEGKSHPKIPSFMKYYGEYEKIQRYKKLYDQAYKAMLLKAKKDAKSKKLLANILIRYIFKKNVIIEATADIKSKAKERSKMRYPPGKKDSLGDRINWLCLLKHVPDNEDIHIISKDEDFYSKAYDDKDSPNQFLEQEWGNDKSANFFIYRTLEEFVKKHINANTHTFHTKREEIITELKNCKTLAKTISVVKKLNKFFYFPLHNVQNILEVLCCSSQLDKNVGDPGIKSFVERIIEPHIMNIDNKEHLNFIDKIKNND